jgi:hypothetical protein
MDQALADFHTFSSSPFSTSPALALAPGVIRLHVKG